MSNKNLIVIPIIVFLAILLVAIVGAVAYYGLAGSKIIDEDGQEVQRYVHECTLVVKEKAIGSDTYFESVSCSKLKKCGGALPFFLGQTIGDVEMWDMALMERSSSKSFETGIFSGEDKITITGCVTDDFELRLYDKERNIQDTWGGN